ncbi:MAG: penicillin-binding protein activator LpoB [Planctomycetota bacterium]|nr:penicillin-binding protein activator LpoB [Planctomycetota bacterium]
MERRDFLRLGLAAAPLSFALGCRSHQVGHVIKDDQSDMVGSHAAGAETFNPLIDESVAKLLARQETQFHPVSYDGGPPAPKRICFVCVENRSIEELGDFKEQIYEQIDSLILQSPTFDPVSRRFVDAALYETRLRPDSLFVPENMRLFMAALEQQGQPFDYLLYAKLTSGTTENNHDFQRDYLLTLEMVNVHTGQYDKESAKVRKGYHHSRVGKWFNYNPFTRQS